MVLVSHEHRFVFLKTRKTAGSSIERFLQPWCLADGVTVPETEFHTSRHGVVGAITGPKARLRKETPWYRPIWYHHMPAADVARQIGRKKFDSYTKISSVRNPFDRMVSYFHFHMRDRHDGSESFEQIRDEFDAFVRSRKWKDDQEIVTLDGRFVIDRMIRFERLAEDLRTTCLALGLQTGDRMLPHDKNLRKRRRSRAVADYYTPELVDIVRNRMAWVFERFGYPLHPLELTSGHAEKDS